MGSIAGCADCGKQEAAHFYRQINSNGTSCLVCGECRDKLLRKPERKENDKKVLSAAKMAPVMRQFKVNQKKIRPIRNRERLERISWDRRVREEKQNKEAAKEG